MARPRLELSERAEQIISGMVARQAQIDSIVISLRAIGETASESTIYRRIRAYRNDSNTVVVSRSDHNAALVSRVNMALAEFQAESQRRASELADNVRSLLGNLS